MTRSIRRSACALVLFVCVGPWVGCMQMPVASLDQLDASAERTQDEEHLWTRARETQVALDGSGMRFEDPALEAYMVEVATLLAGDAFATAGLEPRITVLSNPDMNAMSFPNGVIYVHTALLAHMENEAQLATMLSREIAHVLQRHALLEHRTTRETGNALAATRVFSSPVQGGGYAQMFLQAGSFSSMAGYHHELEKRADRIGLEMMDAAGYDLNEAPRLFERSVAYLAEVNAQRPPAPLGFSFGTPIHMRNRIDGYEKLIAGEYAASAAAEGRTLGADRFNARVHTVRVHQAGLELDRGRFDSARQTAELALAQDETDADAWVVLGEARLRSKSNPDRAGAIEAWERALALDRSHAGAHRGLGFLYYRDFEKRGDSGQQARAHLASYLKAAPDAPDAAHAAHYLERIDSKEPASQ